MEEALTSGRALAKFKEMIENQGGDSSVVDQPEKLLTATYQFDLPAKETGVVQKIVANENWRCRNVAGRWSGYERRYD